MDNISTDKIIEAVLYAVAHKEKMGLDMEESVRVAQNELLHFWSRDMSGIEESCRLMYSK